MNHVALEQPFFMRSCQTYWRTPPKAKICHCSLICWKTIRNYVKCSTKYSGVCYKEGVERIPVRSHCAGSGFQQLTRRELSARKAINFDYLKSSSTLFTFFFPPFLPSSLAASAGAVQMSIVRMKDAGTPGPIGLDYGIIGLIIGQSSGKSRSRAIDALE